MNEFEELNFDAFYQDIIRIGYAVQNLNAVYICNSNGTLHRNIIGYSSVLCKHPDIKRQSAVFPEGAKSITSDILVLYYKVAESTRLYHYCLAF